ncbi:multicopper oxidase family protein [Nocardia otitidiscaviarum]|uniref:multicopper oxidase family protein n=1 Tax=Nocardia otitidiscaviarum TaxID=1823 RepID=UPI0018953053|nr:multicopper oxidase domain-containing protein [Nocardia otitidiscaviarum]MBF6180609.1 multicopper oxidase domain-containing protein [Nocardia otitidiscaviarum]
MLGRSKGIALLTRRGLLAALAATPLVLSACGGSGPTRPSRALPVPPLAASETVDGVRRFRLEAQAGRSEILSGTFTPTWGFNGPVLGPTIRVRRGETVAFTVRNGLPEPTTVHWHGAHVPARCDGGPHQTIAPGDIWEPSWTVDQPAATLWYHPHPHGVTEKHVHRGLAGMFLVDDDTPAARALPHDYGVDDIPLIIQDRRFAADGTFDERDTGDIGLLGDTIVTNGIVDAEFTVRTRRVRLRVLNGSSGRIYHLAFADDREFHLVGTDGGLLPAPVALRRLHLSPGERAEIVVDFADGRAALLRSVPVTERGDLTDVARFGFEDSFDILWLRPVARLLPAPPLPAALVPMTALVPPGTPADRQFDLQWFMINRQRMDMNRIDLTVPLDSTQVWTVRNVDDWPHNFHIHDTRFQVLDIDGRTPPPELAGWKDTVYTRPGSTYTLAMRFTDYADPTYPYMYHCHLLMHEDQGMMGQFLVLAPGQRPTPPPTPAGSGAHGH